MPTQPPPQDPWQHTPVGELQEQLLPRWFVVLALVMVPVAAATIVAAFVVTGASAPPPAERRPPPAGGYTHDVGELVVGEEDPQPPDRICPELAGIQVAGGPADVATLGQALRALCAIELDATLQRRLEAFAEAGGVVRFAAFEATGVDSAAALDAPRILINARFSRTDPFWIAPLIAHDVTLRALDPREAEDALAARRVEHAVCRRLLADRRPSRACEDAAALLASDDPVAALREAGYE